ncbi:hypothetical protein EON66_04220 [archaeon]|nr:MAG: hypothetical protein EON66_04220 [archaeon]
MLVYSLTVPALLISTSSSSAHPTHTSDMSASGMCAMALRIGGFISTLMLYPTAEPFWLLDMNAGRPPKVPASSGARYAAPTSVLRALVHAPAHTHTRSCMRLPACVVHVGCVQTECGAVAFHHRDRRKEQESQCGTRHGSRFCSGAFSECSRLPKCSGCGW